ncbi:MAG TPA: hypothetical protein VGN26_14100, partial [Armatimonadota bacterium]
MSGWSGLYYPYLHFQDDNWLKLAALYMDDLGRIVPSSYATHDSNVVQKLRGEAGFVRDHSPDAGEVDAVSRPFVEMVEAFGDELRDRFGLDPNGGDEVSYVLGDGKLSPRLCDALVDARL